MESSMRVERTRRNFTDESNRYDAKRKRLVLCARALGEEGDAAKVSVTDVTSEMGITRGLFYYYFGSKEELNYAIAHTYVDELVEAVGGALVEGQTREESVRQLVSCVFGWLYDEGGAPRPLQRVLPQIDLTDEVRTSVADSLGNIMISRGLLTDYAGAGDELLHERARFVALAIVEETRLNPAVGADTIAETACSALRYRRRRIDSQG